MDISSKFSADLFSKILTILILWPCPNATNLSCLMLLGGMPNYKFTQGRGALELVASFVMRNM